MIQEVSLYRYSLEELELLVKDKIEELVEYQKQLRKFHKTKHAGEPPVKPTRRTKYTGTV